MICYVFCFFDRGIFVYPLTTQAFDDNSFTQVEPVDDTTSAVTDTQFNFVNLQNIENTPVIDTGFNIIDSSALIIDRGFDFAQH